MFVCDDSDCVRRDDPHDVGARVGEAEEGGGQVGGEIDVVHALA